MSETNDAKFIDAMERAGWTRRLEGGYGPRVYWTYDNNGKQVRANDLSAWRTWKGYGETPAITPF